MGKQVRNSNIELLRIIAMLCVVILHYNNPDIGGGLAGVADGGLNQAVMFFMESLCIIAVNLFLLISGFFMCTTQTRNPWKVVWLVVQVMVFSAGLYLLSVITGGTAFSLKALIFNMIPMNYFVIIYGALYFISPYLNIVLHALNKDGSRQIRTMLIVLGLVFSVWSTLVDIAGNILQISFAGLHTISLSGSQQGYSIVNFTLMYLIGGYLHLSGQQDTPAWKLMLAFIGNTLLLTGWSIAGRIIHLPLHQGAWEYCNPLVIINSILLFQFLRKLPAKTSKLINKLAEGAFTTFLLHSSFLRYFNIPKMVAGNPLVMVGHMLFTAVCIYLLCWCAYFIYNLITKPIFKWIEKKLPLHILNVPLQ